MHEKAIIKVDMFIIENSYQKLFILNFTYLGLSHNLLLLTFIYNISAFSWIIYSLIKLIKEQTINKRTDN